MQTFERPKRIKLKPLEFWNNERVKYNIHGDVIDSTIFNSCEPDYASVKSKNRNPLISNENTISSKHKKKLTSTLPNNFKEKIKKIRKDESLKKNEVITPWTQLNSTSKIPRLESGSKESRKKSRNETKEVDKIVESTFVKPRTPIKKSKLKSTSKLLEESSKAEKNSPNGIIEKPPKKRIQKDKIGKSTFVKPRTPIKKSKLKSTSKLLEESSKAEKNSPNGIIEKPPPKKRTQKENGFGKPTTKKIKTRFESSSVESSIAKTSLRNASKIKRPLSKTAQEDKEKNDLVVIEKGPEEMNALSLDISKYTMSNFSIKTDVKVFQLRSMVEQRNELGELFYLENGPFDPITGLHTGFICLKSSTLHWGYFSMSKTIFVIEGNGSIEFTDKGTGRVEERPLFKGVHYDICKGGEVTIKKENCSDLFMFVSFTHLVNGGQENQKC